MLVENTSGVGGGRVCSPAVVVAIKAAALEWII